MQKQNKPNIARPLDGRQHATEIRAMLEPRVRALLDRKIQPALGIVLVGADPASKAYIATIERAAKQISIVVHLSELPAWATLDEIATLLNRLNTDPQLHGIVVQQPLPPHLKGAVLAGMITPEKDVDGANPTTQGHLTIGSTALFCPATPRAVMELLKISSAWPVIGKHAVIVGKSNVVGLPVALLLLHEGATVSITHIDTVDLAHYTRQAEILVSATGVPGLITGDMLRSGVVVIDVGTALVGEKIVGDVEWTSTATVAQEITPVPGGIGPVTTATLLANVVDSAERRNPLS